jgi:catechol 2,3-dioxygenase-like lactoylglutathione lyase family enzyme
MLSDSRAFNGFAVTDLDEAKRFYGETLGVKLKVLDDGAGLLELDFNSDPKTLAYLQPDATAASYTILNFPVKDIEQAVDELSSRGVTFEQYDGFEQDEKGINRGPGPKIAWFKDPSGNVLSVIED